MPQLVEPATGRPIAPYKEQDAGDLAAAVSAARAAQTTWAQIPYRTRADKARRAAEIVYRRADELSDTISRCTGKTRVDALSTEVLPVILSCRYYAKAVGRRMKPRRIGGGSLLFANKKSTLYRVPYGVVGIISPWNYPFGIPMHEVVTALLAGNGAILKVATQVQPVGDAIADIVAEAGFPPGLFAIAHLPGKTAGDAFLNAGIDKLFFTGSTETGMVLAAAAGTRLVPVNLELGGKDAMIVLNDANLERAAAGALWAGMSNCGQSCAGVERIYVEAPAYESFSRLLRAQVASLRVGADTDYEVDVGSLTTPAQLKTVRDQVSAAVAQGARITAEAKPAPPRVAAEDGSVAADDGSVAADDGSVAADDGSVAADDGSVAAALFHPAMVVEGVNASMTIMREETFGPVVTVEAVPDADEAVRRANDSVYGLTASVWSTNARRARAVADRLAVGTVTINDHLMSHGMAETPWGGFKRSGLGRSHGEQGIDDMTQVRVVVEERLGWPARNLWWYPHGRRVYEGLKGALDLLMAPSPTRRLRGALRTLGLFLERTKPASKELDSARRGKSD